MTRASTYQKTERNQERAKRVAGTLTYYKEHELREGGPVFGEDELQDLLTDMMHYAAQHKVNWQALHEMAHLNYQFESQGLDGADR
ncbi:MAG: hypothetical protein AB1411_15970 [Nitrospirota bacterium]